MQNEKQKKKLTGWVRDLVDTAEEDGKRDDFEEVNFVHSPHDTTDVVKKTVELVPHLHVQQEQTLGPCYTRQTITPKLSVRTYYRVHNIITSLAVSYLINQSKCIYIKSCVSVASKSEALCSLILLD